MIYNLIKLDYKVIFMSINIVFLVVLVLVLWVFFLVYKYTKKQKLSNEKLKSLTLKLEKIKKLRNSSKEKLIDLDKLYHLILKELWYNGTFWEILKQEPKEIRDLNKIWELHKLRNKLVHEFDLISESSLKKKVLEYENQIKKLLK